MKDQLLTYGLVMGKRLRAKDKKIFLQEMAKDLKQQGCQISFVKKKERLQSSTHMILGDLEKAKIILCCPYDTPGKMLIPHSTYTPFHLQHNQRLQTANLILQSLLGVGLLTLAAVALLILIQGKLTYQIVGWVIAVCCSLGALTFFRGLDNRVNMNRCSASVVLLRQCAVDLKTKSEVAIILADQCATSYVGLRQLQQAFPNLQNKVFVWLDSVATGDTLVGAVSPQSHSFALQCATSVPKLKLQVRPYSPSRIESTPLSLFANMVMMGAGDIDKKELVVRKVGTKQDYHVNQERLELIKTMLEKATQFV